MTQFISALPIAAISVDAIPPETWIALASIALTLIVSAAHARGRRLPVIEWLLDAVHGLPKAPPAPASQDGVLRDLLKELQARREATPKEKTGAD